MPRRRMIDPTFWDDHHIAALSRDERLLLLGSQSNADDDGRLKGHPAYLKAAIFMYDDDISTTQTGALLQSCLEKMSMWPKTHPLLLVPYQNANEQYLCFPNWGQTQKPSHPTKSKLPEPPLETLPIFSERSQEEEQKESRDAPSQSRSGQSSLGKVSIGQFSGVQEDFTKFLSTEKDLTDFVTTTLEKYLPRGPTQMMPVIKKLWVQATGHEMSGEVFQVVYMALQKYPIPVLASSVVKAVKYSPGKTKPANYIKTVLEDQMKEHERNRSP